MCAAAKAKRQREAKEAAHRNYLRVAGAGFVSFAQDGKEARFVMLSLSP